MGWCLFYFSETYSGSNVMGTSPLQCLFMWTTCWPFSSSSGGSTNSRIFLLPAKTARIRLIFAEICPLGSSHKGTCIFLREHVTHSVVAGADLG